VNDTWIDFLEQNGAIRADGQTQHFGDPAGERQATRDGNIIADLSHLALIRASGEDAEQFLHNQFSNDLKGLDRAHSQLSAYCSAKGRMFGVLRIVREGDDFLLCLPAATAEYVVKRLGMYVLRSKVTLELDNSYALIGLSGPDSAALATDKLGPLPGQVNEVTQSNGSKLLKLPGPHPRFMLYVPLADASGLWQQLCEKCRPVGAPCWSWLDIIAGLPTVLPATSEAFVPQMTNLDLLHGINFKKGCYPGQEIVARMHYLGKLKQRMILAHLESQRAPAPGDRCYAAGFGDQAAGQVVDAQASPGGGYDLLLVAQIKTYENEALHWGSADGPPLQLLELPYALDQAS
jgi:folate-binding protein YgfZ